MVRIQYLGSLPESVEGFPTDTKEKKFKRSSSGALYLKPRQVKCLTEDEWKWLKENRKDLRCQELKTGEKKILSKKRPVKAEPKKEAASGKKEPASPKVEPKKS